MGQTAATRSAAKGGVRSGADHFSTHRKGVGVPTAWVTLPGKKSLTSGAGLSAIRKIWQATDRIKSVRHFPPPHLTTVRRPYLECRA